MQRGTLTRLRVGFVLLALALLVPLGLLLRSVEVRLEAQRRLRHEIVAERIFDEMERELTALLARERERPSEAYDATQTRAQTWAPFVVGYFTQDGARLHVIARAQLTAERSARVERAVQLALPQTASPDLELDKRELAPQRSSQQQPALGAAAKSSPAAASEQLEQPRAKQKQSPMQKALPETVLRQLNRGAERRDEAKSKVRSAASAAPSGAADDMLDGEL